MTSQSSPVLHAPALDLPALAPLANGDDTEARIDDRRTQRRAARALERTTDRAQLRNGLAVRIALGALVLAGLWILSPFWGWLTLAAWFAAATRPLLVRLATILGGRSRAAAALVVLLFVVVTIPVGALVASMAADGVALVQSALASGTGGGTLRALVAPDASGQPHVDGSTLVDLIQQHGARALELASGIAGSLGAVFAGLFVFFAAAYVLLTDGGRAFAWLERFAPMTRSHVHRLRDAFLETGRGLFIGAGMTGFVQAIIATITYFALGIPRALVLGFLTMVSSVIPGVGTALVWLPLSIGLALSGRLTAGIVLAAIGAIFVSGIDSFIRPFFMKWGKLDLHAFVVLVSMFGAIMLIGPWGILLGPLVARLAVEMIRIAQEDGIL